MSTRSEPLKNYLAKDRISGFSEAAVNSDYDWKQYILALMLSLDLEVIDEYKYRFKKIIIQTELLDLLRSLPVYVGLGVKGDVHKIMQFYSEVSGINLEMAGFIDLSAVALVAGYQMNARRMTPMGVQVLGTILNKCVSTADNMWGYKWQDIPSSLQVMGWEISSLVT